MRICANEYVQIFLYTTQKNMAYLRQASKIPSVLLFMWWELREIDSGTTRIFVVDAFWPATKAVNSNDGHK